MLHTRNLDIKIGPKVGIQCVLAKSTFTLDLRSDTHKKIYP